ncbi:MAG: glutamate-5-semialdehyde dehydrogenase [Rhizobiaceae bacterium]
MTASRKTAATSVQEIMQELGLAARKAAATLALVSSDQKKSALLEMARALRSGAPEILSANQKDMAAVNQSGISGAFLDRLFLDADRIEAMACGVEEIAALPDPVGSVIAQWDRPNGLHIERVRTPLGVIGVIYESRPNVTADAGALCLMAGNAVILRGGSDSWYSANAIHSCLARGLEAAGLPPASIQLVPTTDREAVGAMLTGLHGSIDVIVPRGGRSLVARVQSEARVPVFAHLEGVCHVYVHESSDVAMAKAIAVNSKMRRTGICGSAEKLLVDRSCAKTHLAPVLDALDAAGCEIRASAEVAAIWPKATLAKPQDWTTEYLAPIITVALVSDVQEAIRHIETHSSHHTEAIIAEDAGAVSAFFQGIDSAILLHNASTQFADGGEFGMGAEIGIATGKMHARGPVGVEQLTSFKYRVRGSGQVRP